MAQGLFTVGFTVAEVLRIQERAKEMLMEGKTLMSWSDSGSNASKQFPMTVKETLEECAHALRVPAGLHHRAALQRGVLVVDAFERVERRIEQEARGQLLVGGAGIEQRRRTRQVLERRKQPVQLQRFTELTTTERAGRQSR